MSNNEFKTRYKIGRECKYKTFKHAPDFSKIASIQDLTHELTRYHEGRNMMFSQDVEAYRKRKATLEKTRDASTQEKSKDIV